MILTSYLYVGVHYRRNNGISSEVAPISIVTLWIQVGVVNRCWKQWTVVEHGPSCIVHLVYEKQSIQFLYDKVCIIFSHAR
jgi:hypothetical protein